MTLLFKADKRRAGRNLEFADVECAQGARTIEVAASVTDVDFNNPTKVVEPTNDKPGHFEGNCGTTKEEL